MQLVAISNKRNTSFTDLPIFLHHRALRYIYKRIIYNLLPRKYISWRRSKNSQKINQTANIFFMNLNQYYDIVKHKKRFDFFIFYHFFNYLFRFLLLFITKLTQTGAQWYYGMMITVNHFSCRFEFFQIFHGVIWLLLMIVVSRRRNRRWTWFSVLPLKHRRKQASAK